MKQIMAKQFSTPNSKNGPSNASILIGSAGLVWNLDKSNIIITIIVGV